MEHLSARQIESFLAVARCGSISRAARELYISQPVVSGYMRDIESVFGAALFERSNKGARLTDMGILVYAELYPIYEHYRIALDDALSRACAQERPVLRVGCLRESVMRGVMEDACAGFERDFLDARVSREFYTYHELSEKLICGKLDFIFTHSFEEIPSPDLEYVPLKNVEQYFAAPRAWDIPNSAGGLSALRGRTLVLIASHGADIMLEICRSHGLEPECVRIVDSFLMLTYMLSKNDCYTVCGGSFPGGAHYETDIDFIRTGSECDSIVKIVCGYKRADAGKEAQAFREMLRSG